MEFFLVIEQGLDLMLTGMMTVFIFLGLLILLINISSFIFKEDINKKNIKNTNKSSSIPNDHLQIINQINKRI
ncbi:MAG: OadG family protein [SAR86 cluster bacterium]|nr:OadG family protein [SAR86 cluster bacterium]